MAAEAGGYLGMAAGAGGYLGMAGGAGGYLGMAAGERGYLGMAAGAEHLARETLNSSSVEPGSGLGTILRKTCSSLQHTGIWGFLVMVSLCQDVL